MNKIIKKYLLFYNLLREYNNGYTYVPFIVYKIYLEYSLEYISLLCRKIYNYIENANGRVYNLINAGDWCMEIYLNRFISIYFEINEYDNDKQIHKLLDVSGFIPRDLLCSTQLIKNNDILSILNLDFFG